MADTAPAAVEAPPPPPAPEAPPALTAEQQAVMQQQQAAALAAQQQQFYYAADPNMPNPYYAGGVPMYAANYGYYGGPPVMYPGYAPTLLPPAGDAPQRTRRRRRGSARGRRGGRRDGDNGDANPTDENGDASPRAAPAETPAFSAADFPSLGVATGIKEPAQQWVTPAAPVPAQTLGQEPPAAVAAAPAATEPIKTPPPPPHKPKDGRKCGVCAWFEPSKKMGFIRQDEGGDIFVHASDLRDGVSIEEGDRVEYAVAQFKDRNKAIDVVPISQIVSTTPEEDASDGTQEEEVPVFDATDFPSLGGAARPGAPAAWGASAVPSSLTAPPVVAPAPLVAKRPAPPPSPPRPASTSNDGEKKDQGISQKRKTGVCLWYILKKRHGFIKPDEGGASDIFVHASDLRDGAIEEGDRVEYAVAKFKDRVKAVDVTVLSPAPAAAA
jgi:cold shock CspA family protein